jgi:hypothetical protein
MGGTQPTRRPSEGFQWWKAVGGYGRLISPVQHHEEAFVLNREEVVGLLNRANQTLVRSRFHLRGNRGLHMPQI